MGMPEDRLRYERMVEDALRGVVRQALQQVATRGLPGQHHFYITFRTAPPAVLPDSLREQYPDEMTIVLQHQFWGLEVEPDSFSVTLSFNNRQERLAVPFASVTAFADPAVKFGLQFEAGAREAAARQPARMPEGEKKPAAAGEPSGKGGDVVTLDAFRTRK